MTTLTKALMYTSIGIAGAIFSQTATAQEYPERGVEVIHQFGPGGGTDRFVRAIAAPFEAITGQSLTPISVSGGGGVPATVTVLQRPTDGYTLMGIGPEQVINHVTKIVLMDELVPVARIQFDQGLFLVSKDSPIKSIDDLVKVAKGSPGDLKIAITGTRGFDDTLVGLWNLESNAELTTIPFKASEMVSNTLGGHVDLMYEEYGPSRGLIDSGDLIPLVVFSEKRLPVLPDVPTAKELGYDVTLGRWRGFGVKTGTDSNSVNKLKDILEQAAQSESYKSIEEKAALQYRSVFLGPDEFQTFVDGQIATYTDVLTKLGYIKN